MQVPEVVLPILSMHTLGRVHSESELQSPVLTAEEVVGSFTQISTPVEADALQVMWK